VILEQGVEGREIECAVLGNDDPIASVVGEIITTADFYDYGDKYFDGTSQPVVPADVPQDISDRLRSTALSAFGALRCSGMARVDMFLCDDDILVNEVNTIPGFTPISMYPMMWEASGIGYTELIDRLVELAIERHNRRISHKLSPS
jgi:D-alanine-D-alanine ligase